MTVSLTWLPNTEEDMAGYELQRAPNVDELPGTWEDVAYIPFEIPGPNYNPATGEFFYIDGEGTLTTWYRLRALDTYGDASDYCLPFQPTEHTTPPPFPNTVELTEQYEFEPGCNLVYKDTDGNILPDVQIRVYYKVDYDLRLMDQTIGVTTTDTTGQWRDPILVEAGYTYTVHYEDPGSGWGVDSREVIVP